MKTKQKIQPRCNRLVLTGSKGPVTPSRSCVPNDGDQAVSDGPRGVGIKLTAPSGDISHGHSERGRVRQSSYKYCESSKHKKKVVGAENH